MTQPRRIAIFVALLGGGLMGGVGQAVAQGAKPVATPAFTTDAVMAHVRVLASDEYQGRAPGTKGEDLTSRTSPTSSEGRLKPGNTDGTYVQKVPTGRHATDPATVAVVQEGRRHPDARVQGRCGRVDEAGE